MDLDPGTPFPLLKMSELLTAAKADRVPFEVAWKEAMPQALKHLPPDDEFSYEHEQKDWRGVLNATRDEWQRCYDGEDSGLRGLRINLLTT